MNRRELLTRTGALLGAASLGGCLGQYPNPGTGDQTTDDSPTLADESFEVTDSECGQGSNEATVSFEDESVVVTGTITGSDACQTGTLADTSYDPDEGILDVTVATEEREDTEVCAECITDIDYEATFEFAGGLPDEVSVTHDSMGESETVVTEKRE
ncbi:hypothetical protein [Halorussus amylolyticus]|uniref:hypothetical protein n=1 Tax=Halorussus amylolyticus TaxID=1126242 RepID=UPI0010436FB8|nr:hypothetical protein [Halorussus amylolyticus]